MGRHALLNIPSFTVQVQKIRKKQVTLDVTWIDAMNLASSGMFYIAFAVESNKLAEMKILRVCIKGGLNDFTNLVIIKSIARKERVAKQVNHNKKTGLFIDDK